jgi:hypothetical protein
MWTEEKIYATADDLHLQKTSLDAIISLNERLPAKNGKMWVTTSELLARLIHCGVVSCLEKIQVKEAMDKQKQTNRLERRRKFSNKVYFRQSIFDRGSPKDCRDMQIPPIMPKKNYFRRNNSLKEVKELLKLLNEDIQRVHEIAEGVQNGDVRGKYIILF